MGEVLPLTGPTRGEAPQGLPWERHRSLSGWWQTVWLIVLHPRTAAHAMARSGSLAHAVGFATISFVAHAVTLTLLLLLIAWRHAVEIEALFGADNPVASAVAGRVGEAIVVTWLLGPCAVCASVLLSAALMRAFDASQPLRQHIRAHSYACGVFGPATVPLVGLPSYFMLPVFLYHWLGVRTLLSPAQRGFVVATAVVSGWLIAGAIADAIVGALGPIAFELVSSLVG